MRLHIMVEFWCLMQHVPKKVLGMVHHCLRLYMVGLVVQDVRVGIDNVDEHGPEFVDVRRIVRGGKLRGRRPTRSRAPNLGRGVRPGALLGRPCPHERGTNSTVIDFSRSASTSTRLSFPKSRAEPRSFRLRRSGLGRGKTWREKRRPRSRSGKRGRRAGP